MKITLIRHGKVNLKWKKWYTSKEFDGDCTEYDRAPICTCELKREKPKGAVYISTLPRSRQTAEQLFCDTVYVETELLNEVPLKSFCDCRISLPLWLWNVGGRIQWLLQNSRQSESKANSKKRARRLIEQLEENNQDCILVSHGFFMRVLIGELKNQGFVIDKSSMGIGNLAQIMAVK